MSKKHLTKITWYNEDYEVTTQELNGLQIEIQKQAAWSSKNQKNRRRDWNGCESKFQKPEDGRHESEFKDLKTGGMKPGCNIQNVSADDETLWLNLNDFDNSTYIARFNHTL